MAPRQGRHANHGEARFKLRKAQVRRTISAGAASLMAASLLLATAVPAQAATLAEPPVAATATDHSFDQSFVVSSAVELPTVAFDTYSSAPAETAQADTSASDVAVASASAPVPSVASGSAVLDYAMQFIGTVPYGMGNHPDDSFACDGLTQYVLAAFGVNLPRGADAQASLGTEISMSEAVAGDLVWWPGQHIGFYDGNGGMVDSPDWGRYVQHRGDLWGNPVFIRL